MTRSFLLASAIALAALFGCGSLASRDDASIATVSGKLQGDVPSGTRVAIVWHAPSGGFVVSNEAPVINGTFSFDLTSPPADSLFFSPNLSGSSVEPPSGNPTPAPASGSSSSAGSGAGSSSGGGGSGGSAAKLAPKDVVSGTVSNPLTVAVAGFVLYVDSNANGHLDLTGDKADSPDQIVGGSTDLLLTYLRDGSDLDLEKLRDGSGQLPSRGYDLVWLGKSRWLPLSSVDLTLGVDRLPGDLCSPTGNVTSNNATVSTPSAAGVASGGSSGGSSGGTSSADAGVEFGGSYPSPTDPNLHCFPDGSYTYGTCAPPPPPPPPEKGLCRSTAVVGFAGGCAEALYNVPFPVPAGWPCPVPGEDAGLPTFDGGPGPDAGN